MYRVRDIIEAARKNGLKHIRGSWYSYDEDSDTFSGCIMAQAFYNLTGAMDEDGAKTMVLELDRLSDQVNGTSIGQQVVSLNDTMTPAGRWRTYSELVSALETRAKKLGILDEVVDLG